MFDDDEKNKHRGHGPRKRTCNVHCECKIKLNQAWQSLTNDVVRLASSQLDRLNWPMV